MNIDGCATAQGMQLVTSTLYRTVSHSQQISAIATVILTVPTTEAVYHSYAFSDSPCDIMFTSTQCIPHTYLLVFSCAGLILTTYALSVDRVISTLFPLFYQAYGVSFCAVLLLGTVSYSAICTNSLVNPNAETETFIRCADVPSYMSKGLFSVISLNAFVLIICVFITIFIMFLNKRLEKRIRFDVTIRYRQREALLTSQVVCWITLVLFFGIFIYICGGLIFRIFGKNYCPVTVSLIYRVLYTLPYAATATPALILFGLSYVKWRRKNIIKDLTTAQETTGSRMNELTLQWEASFKKKACQS
ncbi:unnamed protein product [Caenorhabditis auriculariae]|uniref:G-protein coupled receptors family 1 profile domain-containing protein n=1 Tax=Caenorhabditis auriculariae TaxID=2777116 RepID=A0A8S1H3H5_9PELO|nr:unnamed protein product [Caenorhabditis auriculariae]